MLGYLCSRPLNWIELIPGQTDESHSSDTLAMLSENPRWPRTCHEGQRRRREAINSIQHCLRVVASTCLPVCIFLLGVNYSSVFLFRLSPLRARKLATTQRKETSPPTVVHDNGWSWKNKKDSCQPRRTQSINLCIICKKCGHSSPEKEKSAEKYYTVI